MENSKMTFRDIANGWQKRRTRTENDEDCREDGDFVFIYLFIQITRMPQRQCHEDNGSYDRVGLCA